VTSGVFDLDQKYRAGSATVHATGVQAVIRGLLDQLRDDTARGLRTAGFVSGYQGSPLAGFDRELMTALRKVDDVHVVMRPAVNEELGATAVMGSQLSSLHDGPYDGVVGLWYGKAPGLDRAIDAIRHGNYVGSSRWGGAVALVGDDPQAKSSTVPSASEAILADMSIPVLVPADLSDARTMLPYAVALARASGGWVSLKLTTALADGSGTLTIEPVPDWVWPAAAGSIPVNGHLLTPVTLEREPLVVRARGEIVREFADLNPLDRVAEPDVPALVSVVAAGPTALVVREALGLLGLGPDECRSAGVRVVRVGLISPLAPSTAARTMDGVREVVVIEERRNLIEMQLLERFRGRGAAVVGWHDDQGARLVPHDATLTAAAVAEILYARLRPLVGDRVQSPVRRRIPVLALAPGEAAVARTPWYCPGCPHSVSTRVPEGTRVGASIGCACMVVNMPPERVGASVGLVQMGGEGAQWIGMAPFVDLPRITQNVGDGTFFHSGQLALRAAVAAKVDITYKILYNGFVAMTGGQLATGQQSVGTLVRSLLGEGATAVAITTDSPKGYRRRHRIPREVEVHDRADVLAVQERLATMPGVTVMVHDQPCATEMRRARTRGRAPMPTERVVINERVCEGCGDCQTQSACLALVPVPTEFGQKTRIDERACTIDRSCLQGDCPSFAIVPIRKGAPAEREADESLPEPDRLPTSAAVRFAGIGGNGVVTIAHLLGTAALLDGLTVRGLDQTGLAQKGGGVVSDVIITAASEEAPGAAPAVGVDLLIAADPVGAQTPGVLASLDPERTVVIGSLEMALTGDMLLHPDQPRPTGSSLRDVLDSVTRADANTWVDVADVRARLDLSAASANLVLLGVAYQRGLVPVSSAALTRAIELNAVSVAANLAAFAAGRSLATIPPHPHPNPNPNPTFVSHTHHGDSRSVYDAGEMGGGDAGEMGGGDAGEMGVDRLAEELVAYQGAALARRFRSLCDDVAAAVDDVEGGDEAVAAVAFGFHKLLAYKDEYEVARLLLAHPVAEGKVTWMLHPPMLRALGMKRKLRLGPWARPLMHLLVAVRRVRGTWLDPFGRAEVRKVERSLPIEFERAVRRLLSVDPVDAAALARVGRLPDMVRGYEQVKLRSVQRYRAALAD